MKAQRTRQETIALRRRSIAITGIALLLCVAFSVIIYIVNSQNRVGAMGATPTDAEEVVVINGEKYVPKKNIETYLFIGVDASGPVNEREGSEGAGQSDVLMLFVRDISEGTFHTLMLDRNTMADVDSLDKDGNYLATTRIQLAFAHANGDGLESSCENTVKAVSNYLYGQEIDGYAAVNMSAIAKINDMAGGVEVTVEDDFSDIDASLKQGATLTLQGEQAEHFVRARMGMDDPSNTARMRRQSVYMEGLKVKLRQRCAENSSFPLDLYDALGDYMVTNISSQKFSKLAMLVLNDKDAGKLEIKGTSVIGKRGFVEFEADEDSLAQVVTELFYKKYE